MGLQSQLNDVASDSLPFLLLSLIATAITKLRSLFFTTSTLSSAVHTAVHGSVLTSPFTAADDDDKDDEDDDVNDNTCVFCLSGLRERDNVRELTCRHVFHTHCLDGWIGQMKFSCPLCRSPLVSEWRVTRVLRRVGSHLPAWFAVR